MEGDCSLVMLVQLQMLCLWYVYCRFPMFSSVVFEKINMAFLRVGYFHLLDHKFILLVQHNGVCFLKMFGKANRVNSVF